jgi:hypothetical protein
MKTNSRSEKLKKHWATLNKKQRSDRTRKGGLALWDKIKKGNLTMQA